MWELIAIAACLIAVAACVFAVRSRRIADHLAHEMVQQRERFSRLEQGQREQARRARDAALPVTTSDAAAAEAAALTRRLDEMERQVAQAVEQSEAAAEGTIAAADPERELDVRDLVRSGLRRQGYRRVYVLEVTDGDKVVVEAERGGITAKGVAWVEPDGQVILRSQLSRRAFP